MKTLIIGIIIGSLLLIGTSFASEYSAEADRFICFLANHTKDKDHYNDVCDICSRKIKSWGNYRLKGCGNIMMEYCDDCWEQTFQKCRELSR